MYSRYAEGRRWQVEIMSANEGVGDAGVIGNQERFRALSREYAQLSDVTRCFRNWQQVQDDVDTAEMLLEDPEMREMAQDELRVARDKACANQITSAGRPRWRWRTPADLTRQPRFRVISAVTTYHRDTYN
ncbi:hypothetical protein CRX72_20260 [Pantoea sp. BRM17]|nr:hypothetical protein CRX72_20260 [Pantoea sp. BRM17]